MTLSSEQVLTLVDHRPITTAWPWGTNDRPIVNSHIRGVIDNICTELTLKHKSEFDDYGSGFASFVECWLYREDPDFRYSPGNHYWGLVILFSRLSNFVVLGQGQKTWTSASAGSFFLPDLNIVDEIHQPCCLALESDVTRILEAGGFVRLRRADLADALDPSVEVSTILSDPPWRQFDALFYWYD